MSAEYLYLTYSGIQFLVYQQTKVFLNKTAQISAQKATAAKSISTTTGAVVATPLHGLSAFVGSSAIQSFIAGASAGIAATACTYPFDLLRTRFAVQRDVKVSRKTQPLFYLLWNDNPRLDPKASFNATTCLGVYWYHPSFSTYLSSRWYPRVLSGHGSFTHPGDPVHGHHVWIVRHT